MSGQGPATTHKVRRPTTPPQMALSSKGPLKAVQPFSSMLRRNSTSRSPSSPNYGVSRQRKSPDIGPSTDRRSPGSPGFKGKIVADLR